MLAAAGAHHAGRLAGTFVGVSGDSPVQPCVETAAAAATASAAASALGVDAPPAGGDADKLNDIEHGLWDARRRLRLQLLSGEGGDASVHGAGADARAATRLAAAAAALTASDAVTAASCAQDVVDDPAAPQGAVASARAIAAAAAALQATPAPPVPDPATVRDPELAFALAVNAVLASAASGDAAAVADGLAAARSAARTHAHRDAVTRAAAWAALRCGDVDAVVRLVRGDE